MLGSLVVSSCRHASGVGMEGGGVGELAVIGGELSALAVVTILITGTTGQNNDDRFAVITSCLLV